MGDSANTTGLLNQLGTVNAAATVNVDSNTILEIVVGVLLIVVCVFVGAIIYRSSK